MTQSDTPETDENSLTWDRANRDGCDADFARRLERERDEARKTCDAYLLTIDKAKEEWKKVCAERDHYHITKNDEGARWQIIATKAEIERDQLRKVADYLAHHLSTHWEDNGVEAVEAAGALQRYNQLPHVIAKQKESK